MNWFVYIVRCNDNSLYTGITNNIGKRIWEHNNKKGAKSLKGKLPVKLIYKERYNNHQEAARREKEIKSWRRKKKLELIEGSP
jgi:putative endonuclease